MSVTAWLAVAVLTVVYVLIATERVHRVAAALGGPVLMLLIGAAGFGGSLSAWGAGKTGTPIFGGEQVPAASRRPARLTRTYPQR
ncbi:hypothetical protein ACFXJJ_19580, partial [Streptomyces sp. NPDC059233]